MSTDEQHPSQPFEGDWNPDSPSRLEDILDCIHRAGMKVQADRLAADEIEPGERLAKDLANEARLHTDIRLEHILLHKLFGEERPEFLDTEGRPISPMHLPIGAPWTQASPEELERAGTDQHSFIKIACVLSGDPADVARSLAWGESIVDGSFAEKLADQNARMRALDLPED